MALYDRAHLISLRAEMLKLGLGYISDIGLIEFDKAIRLSMISQLEAQ